MKSKQAKIRITKEFNFEMAHALWNYDGACKNLHGHSYKLFVTLIGEPIDDVNNTKNGMVVDFSELKHLIHKKIISRLDHAVLLPQQAVLSNNIISNQMLGKVVVVDYQPTCENMLIEFAKIIQPELNSNTKLFSLKLYETVTSFAEWYASDNV